MTTDGSGAVTGITDSKGKYDITLTAPGTNGDHDIQAHFAGNSQYESSDSTVKITVEEPKVSSQKTTVTTNQQNTDEEQTDEETEEQPEEPEEEPEEETE